jgi:hypothetical protein
LLAAAFFFCSWKGEREKKKKKGIKSIREGGRLGYEMATYKEGRHGVLLLEVHARGPAEEGKKGR